MTGGPAPGVRRTPDERFCELPGYPFAPHYLDVADPELGPLRVHYVDEGPPDADPVLLVHGEPTWSYLFRGVVTHLAARGHRAVAVDLVGFGRSDKPVDPTAYSYARHLDWLDAFVTRAGLERVTLVVHDWGGPLGLGVLARRPDRFARVVAANTVLHPAGSDDPAWAVDEAGGGRVTLPAALVDYVTFTQRAPHLEASAFVRFATATEPPAAVLAAYDAPFPDADHQGGVRQFPVLIPLTPSDPGMATGRATWTALERFERPFLTAYADGDPATAGWDRVFQRRVPGARGLHHVTVAGAGHFCFEDRPDELATVVERFVAETS